MRFMIMHKMTEEMEKGLPPDPALIAGVDKGYLRAAAIEWAVRFGEVVKVNEVEVRQLR